MWVQAMSIADDDPSAAITLCQQALDTDTGNRASEESIRGFQLGLIARTGDTEAALAGFTRIIDAYQESSGDHYTGAAIRAVVEWLARLGYHEGAAQLFGALTRGQRRVLALPAA